MKKSVLITATLVIATAGLWTAGLFTFALQVKDLPAHVSETKTDAIVVLTGGPDRINTGLDLLADGKADHLFISGVNEKVTVADILALWRDDPAEPPCCIALGRGARNTRQNAEEAAFWVGAQGIGSIRLLTADYHMPRAYLEFRAMMPDVPVIVHALPAARRNWLLLASEYNKTIFTFLRVQAGKILS